MKKKEIYKRRLNQLNADVAENNRRVRGHSRGWEKKAEAKMDPWRRLSNPDPGGLGGKTYLHSGIVERPRSKSAEEQIDRLTRYAKKGRLTRAGKKSRKQLRNIVAREKEAKAKGLTEYELLKGKEGGKKLRKKSIKGILEEQGY
jgi:hypothetical protein